MVVVVVCIMRALKWLAGSRSVGVATNLGHPANKQNEWMLMFVAEQQLESEDNITCATIVQP